MAYKILRSGKILRNTLILPPQEEITTTYYNYDSIEKIPGLTHHYDASGLVINTDNSYGTVDISGNISSWKNLASTNHAIQTTPSSRPTLNVGVNFNGSQYFNFTNIFNLYESTIILVFKLTNSISTTATSSANGFLSTDTNGRASVDVFRLMGYGPGGTAPNGTISIKKSTSTLGSYSQTDISNSRINKLVLKNAEGVEFYYNDVMQVCFDISGLNTRIRPLQNYGTMYSVGILGNTWDLTSGFGGIMYEVILINRKIKSYEMDYINYKINQKWGI